MDQDKSTPDRRRAAAWGSAIAIGLGVGIAIGVAMGNIGAGIAIGAGLAVAFAIAFDPTLRGRGGRRDGGA